MKECKPLHLFVSLLPEDLLSPQATQAAAEISGASRVVPSAAADVGSGRAEDVCASTHEIVATQSEVSNSDDSRPTPWVLDICLVSTKVPDSTSNFCHGLELGCVDDDVHALN